MGGGAVLPPNVTLVGTRVGGDAELLLAQEALVAT